MYNDRVITGDYCSKSDSKEEDGGSGTVAGGGGGAMGIFLVGMRRPGLQNVTPL